MNDVRVNNLYKYRKRLGTTEPVGGSTKVLGDGLERTVLDKAQHRHANTLPASKKMN